MKKYLITTADIKRIKKCRDAQGSWTALNALTPIEPLSSDVIEDIAFNAMPNTPCGEFMEFTRDIERHILGSEA